MKALANPQFLELQPYSAGKAIDEVTLCLSNLKRLLDSKFLFEAQNISKYCQPLPVGALIVTQNQLCYQWQSSVQQEQRQCIKTKPSPSSNV